MTMRDRAMGYLLAEQIGVSVGEKQGRTVRVEQGAGRSAEDELLQPRMAEGPGNQDIGSGRGRRVQDSRRGVPAILEQLDGGRDPAGGIVALQPRGIEGAGTGLGRGD